MKKEKALTPQEMGRRSWEARKAKWGDKTNIVMKKFSKLAAKKRTEESKKGE